MQEKIASRVLVTGSQGLIGSALTVALEQAGYAVQRLDLREQGERFGDVRDAGELACAMQDCAGVVHLAAASRVFDGERDPVRCWAVNVDGTRNVVEAALAQARHPWLIYASSREVYGQSGQGPVTEDALRRPVNLYGRSKVAAEDLVAASALQAAVLRFSNVYGSTRDHPDRVVPAFARRAVLGLPLQIEGSGQAFDFTHLTDVVRGLIAVIERLERGERLTPIHLVTGSPTTLGELAALAVELAGSDSALCEAPARSFDVTSFHGNPGRAADLLGWRASVGIREGLGRLIRDFEAINAMR